MSSTPDRGGGLAVRCLAVAGMLSALLVAFISDGPARAQSLTVLPVSIQMAPGQMSSELMVINMGDTETSVQVRAFIWSQTSR